MPKKSMAAPCSSGKESSTRLLRSRDESTKYLRSRSSTSTENKVSKKPRKSSTTPQSVTRSPIITRSRSRSLGLQQVQPVNLVDSSMDCSSQTPVEESLKRKHPLNLERKTGESSKESVAKRAKSSSKKTKASNMSNAPTHSKNELNNASDISSGRGDGKDTSANKIQTSDSHDESLSGQAVEASESASKGSTSPSSSTSDNSRSNLLETGALSNERINNSNLDDNSSVNPPVEDFILACSRLSQAEATAQQLASFSCNENELSNEARKQKYEILKNISDRKLITNSDFQKSLLSVMQRTRNSQNNKNSEIPLESRPGGSGTSEFQNVLRIKVEKDDESTKDQCKFSKTSNLRDGNSSQQSYFKPPAASSSGAQSNAFNNISVKQEMDIPSAEEISNPFLTRRIFIPDNIDSESAQGLSSANNTAAVGSSDSIDGEIGRLQALMDSRRIPISLFGALESRMQQLFHKSMGTATSSRAQQLLQELQAAEDDEHQLQVLIEISQLLVMGNEDTLIGFPVKQIVPLLINLLLKEYNFELMNQACRALTYLIEALPRSSSVVVEAVPVLLNKVQVIQCIDVAEQALTALKMLSKWHSKAILQAKGVSACLMHLDFFSINAQRTALAIIANCCQNILPHEFSLVQDSLSILSGWLTRQDEKSVESICLAFSGLVECFQHDHDCLMQIGSHDLLTNIQQLLVVSPPIISSQIFTTVIHMLALMCASCSEIVVFLLQQDFAETLQYLLTENCDSAKEIELTPRSPHEYLELSSLICEIMPSLPPDDLFSINALIVAAKKKSNPPNSVIWQWKDDAGFWHSHEKNDSKNIEEAYQRGNVKLYISDRAALNIDLQTMEQFDEGTGSSRQLRRHIISSSEDQSKNPRTNFFRTNEDLVISSIKILFPVLFEIYCSSAGSTVKHKCLRAMLRMVYFAPPDVLHQVLKKQAIARHIASMLATQEFRTVIAALQLAEILMQKLPSEFRVHFIREGVLHEIRALAKIDAKTWQIENNTAEASTSFSSNSSAQVQSFDCLGDAPQISKSDAGQSSSASMPVFSNSQASSSLLKEDESNGSNVASKIRDALKRRYMTIKRTFGAGDKDVASLCGADLAITVDSRMKINNWIKEQAQNFDDKYFNVDQINSHPVINVLNILTKAVQGLECMDDCGLRSLIEVRDVVTQNDISSFELIHSGLVKKLEQYLSAVQGESMPFGIKSLEDRLRTFLHVFIGSPLQVTPEIQPEKFDASPLVNLITKLNACVSHLEQFPVKVYDQPSNGNTGRPGASIMKFFNMHQLKCLFQRHPSCTTLRQWHSGPVMIDPLASIHNIDRYLVNQGFGSLKEDDESESDLSYDDSSDEDGGLIVADIRMDHGHGSPKLQFLIGKNVLPYNMTLYQAVRQYGSGDSQNSSNAQNLDCEYPVGYASVWLKTHTIWYRPIPPEDSEGASSNSTNAPQTSSGKKKSSSSRSSHSKSASERTKSSKNKKDALWDNGIVPEVAFPSSFTAKLSGFDTIKDPSLDVIILLRVIHSLSYHWGLLYQLNSWSELVPQAAFINNELTLKVNRQLHDPLAIMTGNTPSWLSHIAYNFPFLFPFETRHLLFYVTSFDRERALQRLIDTVPELTNAEKITPRLEKRKRTVSRSSLLKQAETILQDHGDSKALLEIQYKNEVGTGLGPTLEFYALVSKELQRADLDMWHAVEVVTDDGKDPIVSYAHSPAGLFPMPVSRNARTSSLTKVCNKFKLLGKFLAKAIMDSRLVDIPLSLAFFKWMLNQERYLSLGDLQHIDESLAHNIIKLEKIVIEKKKLEKDSSLNPVALKRSLDSITLEGCSVEDLSLDFTLPGYSRIEMKKGGKDVPVSIHNIEDYLKLLKYWTMTEGVSKQMKAFKDGFETVFSLNRLQVFYPEELAYLFCGNVHNQWDIKSLTDSCRPDHGYTYESQAIKFLFEVLSSYDANQQRQFIQFITGSPRLPIGGLKSLSPPLTIVKKTSDDETNSDNYLPSVMTCVNYLKLPDYSSIEIMREKLQMAISEGQHSFHLS